MTAQTDLHRIIAHFGPKPVQDAMTRAVSIWRDIGQQAALPMPPMAMYATGLLVPGRGAILATAQYVESHGMFQPTIILPISTSLLITDDKVFRRILVHECAHAFWLTLHEGQNDNPEFGSIDEQLNHDLNMDTERLADPADWFGQDDAEDFMYDGRNDPGLSRFSHLFSEVWLANDLPWCLPPLFYRVPGRYGCHRLIAERMREIPAGGGVYPTTTGSQAGVYARRC